MDLIRLVNSYGSAEAKRQLNELLTRSSQSTGDGLALDWLKSYPSAAEPEKAVLQPKGMVVDQAYLGLVEKLGLKPFQNTHMVVRASSQISQEVGPTPPTTGKPVSSDEFIDQWDLLPSNLHIWHRNGAMHPDSETYRNSNTTWGPAGGSTVAAYSYDSLEQLLFLFASLLFGKAPWVVAYANLLAHAFVRRDTDHPPLYSVRDLLATREFSRREGEEGGTDLPYLVTVRDPDTWRSPSLVHSKTFRNWVEFHKLNPDDYPSGADVTWAMHINTLDSIATSLMND